MAGQILKSIGGNLTLSGGTRTAVKTDRPWQPKLVFPKSSADCPFCSRKQEDEYVPGEGWKTFQNSNTPFPYHRLLIPTECWEEQKLRSLGGEAILAKALKYALAEVARTREKLWPTWMYTHIGHGAGQNLGHHHWHLCGAPNVPDDRVLEFAKTVPKERILKNDVRWIIFAEGVRAGQIFVCPRPDWSLRPAPIEWLCDHRWYVIKELAEEAANLIALFNQKFNYPDYCLFLALNSETDWHFRYTPILNNWGGSEYAALDYGTPFVLPWAHEATVEFLKS